NLVSLADQQRTMRTELRVESGARHWRPAALFCDIRHGARKARKEFVCSLFPCWRNIPERVHAYFQTIGCVARTCASFTMQVDQRTEPAGLASNDCDHQRQAKLACTYERLRCAAHAQPDGQRILHRSRVDA